MPATEAIQIPTGRLPCIAKDVGGVAVDRVLVSEGTRAMARPAGEAPYAPKPDVTSRQEREELVARQHEIQARLTAIGGRIKGNRIPPNEYRSLCGEQTALTSELSTIIPRLVQLKEVCRQQAHEPRVHEELGGVTKMQAMALVAQKLDATNELLRELVALMKARES